MANYHIVKDSDEGWNIRREGSIRISQNLETQRKAEDEAKRLAGNSGGGEVRIHGVNGKIRDSDTVAPANDPYPPRDRVY